MVFSGVVALSHTSSCKGFTAVPLDGGMGRWEKGHDLTMVPSRMRRKVSLESRVDPLGKPRIPGMGALGRDPWIGWDVKISHPVSQEPMSKLDSARAYPLDFGASRAGFESRLWHLLGVPGTAHRPCA